jgi:OmpA-OmpF porin, OOP family
VISRKMKLAILVLYRKCARQLALCEVGIPGDKVEIKKLGNHGEGAHTYMKRISWTLMLAALVAASIGCSSKNYVRQQTTPLINKTNELDDMTAKNSKDIKDVDQRAEAGIQQAQANANAADQKALAAGASADKAQMAANGANQRVDTLTNTVINLDNYRSVAETSVHFGFNKDNLTKDAKDAIDQLAASVATTKGYIITVEGATDSIGSSDYNYDLSQRRADAVIQYLASEKSIPAYKIYLIGLGKDKPVETNKTSAGRAKNRRVDIHLMSNTGASEQPSQQTSSASPSSM